VSCLSVRKVATVLVGHIISTTKNYLSALDDCLLVGLPPKWFGPATVALFSIFFLQSEAVDTHLLFAAVEEVLPQGKVEVVLLLFLHLL
jgi:hypothetical protein